MRRPISRGARLWGTDEATDLFDAPPPPAPPPAPVPPAEARHVPTDRECRRMERALESFKLWLLNATLDALDKAKPAALAVKYPPITAPDIAQMIEVRAAGQRKKAKA